MERALDSIFSVGDSGIRLLNALGEAVIATDAQGRIVVWNDSASRLYGYSEDEARDGPFTKSRCLTSVTLKPERLCAP